MMVIIDYGMGNLASIKNMFKHINIKDVIISSDKAQITKADKIILPGVGAFDAGIEHLKKYGLIEVLNEKVLKEKVPTLGICLGMQLMTNGSEEGKLPGLGWIDAETIKFQNKENLKIPHMGWNYVKEIKRNFNLQKQERYRFYFVHSYYVKCNVEQDVLFTTEYGVTFHSAFMKDNIIGVQFHPEKSLHFGMDILKDFGEL